MSDIKKYLLIALFILSILPLFGQENDSLFYFRGKVISKEGKYPVAKAHVINLNQRHAVSADTIGNFNIWVKPGDALNFSAIGFDFLEYIVPGIIKDSLVKIYMQNRSYEIPEVSITYLGTYREFKNKVLGLELPESKVNKEFEKLFKHVEIQPLYIPSTSIFNPASLVYSLVSKEGKEIRKYLKLTENQEERDQVRERYNEQVIQNLTGLHNLEAQQFMKFCDFQDKYILSIDDYNLYSEIMMRYKSFKKSNQDSLKSE